MRGLFSVDAMECSDKETFHDNLYGYFHKGDYALTSEQANERVKEKIKQALTSLEKRRAKLEKLKALAESGKLPIKER
jgi:hypothetical protein